MRRTDRKSVPSAFGQGTESGGRRNGTSARLTMIRRYRTVGFARTITSASSRVYCRARQTKRTPAVSRSPAPLRAGASREGCPKKKLWDWQIGFSACGRRYCLIGAGAGPSAFRRTNHNHTAILKERWSNASLTGLDNSRTRIRKPSGSHLGNRSTAIQTVGYRRPLSIGG